jgi:hypothetical protein
MKISVMVSTNLSGKNWICNLLTSDALIIFENYDFYLSENKVVIIHKFNFTALIATFMAFILKVKTKPDSAKELVIYE